MIFKALLVKRTMYFCIVLRREDDLFGITSREFSVIRKTGGGGLIFYILENVTYLAAKVLV